MGSDERVTSGGKFRWGALAFWLIASALDGAGVAWLASLVEPHWAPLLVFPLLVGCALGMTLTGLMRLAHVGHRPTLLLGVLVAVATAVIGQHFAAYREAVATESEDAETFRLAREAFGDRVVGRLPSPPDGLPDFLLREADRGRPLWGTYVAKGAVAWITWALDAALVAAGALAVIMPAWRQPYCDSCRSWFRTTRRGPLAPAAAVEVGTLAGITVPEGVEQSRYRMVACAGGCRLSGLELSWRQSDGKRRSASGWLDADARNEVMRKLDVASTAENQQE